MRYKTSTYTTLAGFFAALALQGQSATYSVTDLGTLPGGTFSQAFSITHNGLIGGSATLHNGNQQAVFWYKGLKVDMGAPGLNSITYGANQSGQGVGESERHKADPNGEDFCGFGTHLVCVPFLWQSGVMTPLPMLGGHNGFANQINSRGVAVGYAENTTKLPATCPLPQVLEVKPVLWENGKAHEFPTFAGDPEGIALGINDSGQAVGSSGGCAAFNPNTGINLFALHALLWEKEKMIDLGNLGGAAGDNISFAVNNLGQAVGSSDLAGGSTFHAFLWSQATAMQDLGTLPGDMASNAPGINDKGEVVGVSLDASFNPRAFLWRNGVMTDLNTLVAPSSTLYLLTGCSINDNGEIVGLAVDTGTGEPHAYLASPNNGSSGTR
jgi:probable HAF family extracellular repeat protein